MTAPPRGVLFLCVANSSRSQMAEGLARTMLPPEIEVFSAGSSPATVNPFAVRAMQEIGIDITGQRSKSVDDIDKAKIGTVFTLCAEEVCPVLPGDVTQHHLPFEDPAAATGTEADKLAAFRRVRDQIAARLRSVLPAPPP